jgi:HEAT repeats
MSRWFDQESLPESVSDEQLVAVLEGRAPARAAGRAEIGKVDAIKELARRRSSGRTEVLARVATEAEEPEEVRTAAVVELGHEDSRAARDALTAALRSGDPAVARRAAEALGRVGEESALEALESAEVPGPARRSAQFARSLLAYRLGRDAHRIPRPAADAELDLEAADTEPVDVRAPDPTELTRALTDLARDLPGFTRSTAGARVLTCDDVEYLVVLNGELRDREALRRIQERPAMPAVVVKLAGGLDRFYLHAYVLTHPTGSALELLVSRTTGDVTHVGSARIEGSRASFSLRAVATPLAVPVQLEGTLDTERMELTIERALAQRNIDRARQGGRQPRRVDVLAPSDP